MGKPIHSRLLDFCPLDLWYENMTSSIKPEVHNISQRRQRRTEPRPQAACVKKLVKFGRAIFELCEQTHRHTDRQTNRHYSVLYFAAKQLFSDLVPSSNRLLITVPVAWIFVM